MLDFVHKVAEKEIHLVYSGTSQEKTRTNWSEEPYKRRPETATMIATALTYTQPTLSATITHIHSLKYHGVKASKIRTKSVGGLMFPLPALTSVAWGTGTLLPGRVGMLTREIRRTPDQGLANGLRRCLESKFGFRIDRMYRSMMLRLKGDLNLNSRIRRGGGVGRSIECTDAAREASKWPRHSLA